MKKLEEIQRGKLISAYGGVGSIVETLNNGSLKILPFEQWPIYSHLVIKKDPIGKSLLVEEPRLKKRLNDVGFTGLRGLFTLAEVNLTKSEVYSPLKATLGLTVKSEYFPRWFYCPHCRKFQPIEDWEKEWNGTNYKFRENPPACHNCSSNRRKVRLEQTRFVLASMDSGEIIDVPWGDLFDLPADKKAWDYPTTPNTTVITFNTSSFTDNLYGLSVKRVTDNCKVRLSEIDNKYFIKDCHAYKMVLRNANNIYFPYIFSSIYIPLLKIDDKITGQIKSLVEANQTLDGIVSLIKILYPKLSLTKQKVETLINSGYDPASIEVYKSEEDFRDEEYDYITNLSNYNNSICEIQDFISIHMQGITLPSKIKNIFCLKKLKETKVQVAYSRIDNVSSAEISKDYGIPDNPKTWYNVNTDSESIDVKVRVHPTSSKTRRDLVEYLPATVSTGEGFFIELDLSSIPDENIDGHDQNKREVFLHTYCHLIMKELEFQCGYPLASLSERLYYLPSKGDGKYGFMIYTIGGEEGSFGGITSLFSNGAVKILKIIDCAIRRATDCPNDPICEQEGGHCFACLDLPETSCELFNKKLSRVIFNKNI